MKTTVQNKGEVAVDWNQSNLLVDKKNAAVVVLSIIHDNTGGSDEINVKKEFIGVIVSSDTVDHEGMLDTFDKTDFKLFIGSVKLEND